MHCVDSLKLVNGSELVDGPELKHLDKDKKCQIFHSNIDIQSYKFKKPSQNLVSTHINLPKHKFSNAAYFPTVILRSKLQIFKGVSSSRQKYRVER